MAAIKYDYPEGLTTCDHLAHDIKQGRFPERSSIDQFICERGNDSLIQPDLVPMLLDVSIDPCDGSVHSSLQYVLIRGFTAMGWEQPKAASEDMAMEILKMIRPSNLAAGGTVKPSKQSVVGENPISQGMLRTQEIMCAETMKAKIATLAQRFWSIHPSEIAAKNLTREQFYAREMEKLLIQPGPSDPSSTRSEVTVESIAYRVRVAILDHYPTMNALTREAIGDAAAEALLDQFEIRRK